MSDFSSLLPFFTTISKDFPDPNFHLEQYITSLSILQEYFEAMPDLSGTTILDLGIGTGLLSFLAIKKGANRVIGIDIDSKVLKLASQIAKTNNINNLNLIHSGIEFFNFDKFASRVDGVIMNPPFGTKRKFLDFVFLKKALQTKGWIITLHKNNPESDRKLRNLCSTFNYLVEYTKDLTYSLPNTHKIHKLTNYNVDVKLYYLVPNF